LTAAYGKSGEEGTPQHQEYPTADYGTALLLAFGIASALFVRASTGRGQRLDTSLLGSALAMQNNALLHVDALDTWRDAWLADLASARAAGESLEQLRARRQHLQPEVPTRTYYRTYATADGFITIGALTPTLQAKIRALIGLEDPWMEHPDQTPADPHAYTVAIAHQAEAVFRTRSTAAWQQALLEAGVPVAPLQFTDEMFHDPQVSANGLIVTQEHPLLGTYRQLASPLQLSATPFRPGDPSPTLGEHTDAVLRFAGFDDDEIAELRRGQVAR